MIQYYDKCVAMFLISQIKTKTSILDVIFINYSDRKEFFLEEQNFKRGWIKILELHRLPFRTPL